MRSALQAERRWAYSDLVALPDDQLRHELSDREHFVSPSREASRQLIVWHLTEILAPYLRANPVGVALTGPSDVKLSLFTVPVTDLVYRRQAA